MFPLNSRRILPKNYIPFNKFNRRFSGTSGTMVNLLEEIKEARNNNSLVKLKFDSLLRNYNIGNSNNEALSSQSRLDSGNLSKCADGNFTFLANPGLPTAGSPSNLIFKQNKDLIIASFGDILRYRHKNPALFEFLSDSVTSILDDLEFGSVCNLINSILGLKLTESRLDDKVDELFQKLLARLNELMTQSLSQTRVVKTSGLSKYSIPNEDLGLSPSSGIDVECDDQVDRLWLLWHKLANRPAPGTRYTLSLLLSILELAEGSVFRFDLGRATRTLDTIVGNRRHFTKLEERFILRLLRRLTAIMANAEVDPSVYIKTNNVTPIKVKKLLCNLSVISKVAPKILEEALKHAAGTAGLVNFAKISKALVTRELDKVDFNADSATTDGSLDTILDEVNSKRAKFFLGIFVDSVDVIRFLDYLRLKHSDPECDCVRNELIAIASKILSKLALKTDEQVLAETRASYYLFLTSCLCSSHAAQTQTESELLDAIFTKIASNTERLIGLLESAPDGAPSFKPVQFLLFCDRMVSLFGTLGLESEPAARALSSCLSLAIDLSRRHREMLSSSASQGLRTLYVTLLNKYGLLTDDLYRDFLAGIGSWDSWGMRDIAMICDLLTRTRPAVDSQLLAEVTRTLDSLVRYVFLEGNADRLGNRELVSLVACADGFRPHIAQGYEDTAVAELSGRLDRMGFSQLVRLIDLDGTGALGRQLAQKAVEAILALDRLGDVSCLDPARHPDLLAKIFAKFEVRAVTEREALFVKLVRNKFLTAFGPLAPVGSFTTRPPPSNVE